MAHIIFENADKLIQEAELYLKNERGCHILRHISTGNFGYVAEIFDFQRSRLIAAKVVKRYTKGEIDFWQRLCHPYVLPLYEIVPFIGKSCIFLMPLKQCSLKEAIVQRDFRFDVNRYMLSKQWMYQVLCGLSYLHNNELSHLDITTDNILLSDARNAILADFTYLAPMNVLVEIYEIGDELPYRAPEVRRFEEHHCNTPAWFLPEKLDLWSYGIVALELVTDRYLNRNLQIDYNGQIANTTEEIIYFLNNILHKSNFANILRNTHKLTIFEAEEIRNILEFLLLFLQINPDNRVSVNYALSHHFLTSSDSSVQNEQINNNKYFPYCTEIEVEKNTLISKNSLIRTPVISTINLHSVPNSMADNYGFMRKAKSINFQFPSEHQSNSQAILTEWFEEESKSFNSLNSSRNPSCLTFIKSKDINNKRDECNCIQNETENEENLCDELIEVYENINDDWRHEDMKIGNPELSKHAHPQVYDCKFIRTIYVKPRKTEVLNKDFNNEASSEIAQKDSIVSLKGRQLRPDIEIFKVKHRGYKCFANQNYFGYMIRRVRNLLKTLKKSNKSKSYYKEK